MAGSEARVDLLGTIEVLHRYLTKDCAEAVFDEARTVERRRQLTLTTLAEFWTAVILRAPDSLSQALAEANGTVERGSGAAYPRIETTRQAFFSRCRDLDGSFFERLFQAFQAAVDAAEPPAFARDVAGIAQRFGGRIWAVDASALDKVARRLRVLRNDRRVPLPGMLIAFYDICAGRIARLKHHRELQPQEGPCAREMLPQVPAGTLLVGDRLYGRLVMLEAVSERDAFYVVGRHQQVNFAAERELASHREGGVHIQDWIGTYGTGNGVPAQSVRLIRKRQGRRSLELVTNVLDPEQLSAQEALALYRQRWKVERLFYELKEVLNLHRFYGANLNAISMQVYAAAIVHTAMRVAQARIAKSVGLEPEALSTQKLFVRVAAASASLAVAEVTFVAVQQANPKVILVRPDWRTLPFAWVWLKDILVELRGTGGRQRRIKPDGRSLRTLPKPRRKGGR